MRSAEVTQAEGGISMSRKILLTTLLSGSTFATAQAADLTVVINGVPSDRGYIVSAVFNSEASFLKRPEALANVRIKAAKGDLSYTLKNLPPGKYAVTAFHDANGNEKLDADATGQPTELYGFSNDARASGPPAFADAAIELGAQSKSIDIRLAY
jgi:uncharacterized protein (DUF2141 family)